MIETLKNGGVAVLLTDTLYGLVGQALNKKTVARIYKIKDRNSKKPLIILIYSIKDLKLFGIKVNDGLKKDLKKFWPGPVSIILPCPIKKFEYLHRGTKTLAFRIPRKNSLIKILKKTGPLVAPSANPENLPPAQNITEAKKYFGKNVDFFLNGPKSKNKPSKLIKIHAGNIEFIRK
jgi:L-threonylcarbamoyladenylate synthase